MVGHSRPPGNSRNGGSLRREDQLAHGNPAGHDKGCHSGQTTSSRLFWRSLRSAHRRDGVSRGHSPRYKRHENPRVHYHPTILCYPAVSPFFFSFDFLAFSHRARTALRAISLRCSDVSFAARIFPPLEPPNLPKATACGFFFLGMSPRRYSAGCGQINTY
jgi:hypothetical protein